MKTKERIALAVAILNGDIGEADLRRLLNRVKRPGPTKRPAMSGPAWAVLAESTPKRKGINANA